MTCTPDYIGLIPFLSLEGGLEAIKKTTERVDRPGVDGMAYRDMGWKAKEFQLVSTMDYASVSAAAVAEATYLTYVNTVTTVTQKSITYPYMMVLDVGNFRKQICAIGVGGLSSGTGTAGACILTATWTITNVY